jgi:hypothetical protein
VVDDKKNDSTDAATDATKPDEAVAQPDVTPTDPAEATKPVQDEEVTPDTAEPVVLSDDVDDRSDDEQDTDTGSRPDVAPTEPPDLSTSPIDPAPSTSVAEPARGGTFGAALLGGAIAALVGFAIAESDVLDPLLPPSWQEADPSAQIETLSAELAQLKSAQTETAQALAAVDLAALGARIEDLAATLEPLGGQIAQIASDAGGFAERLEALEGRPAGDGAPQASVEAYEGELARLSEAVAAQRATVEQMVAEARQRETDAADAARAATLQRVVARLGSAVAAGEPYDAVLGELADTGAQVPQVLSDHAAEGVASLPALRESFPPAAREALAATRTGGGGEGIGAFLQRQLGARSVSPRAGDDADAILSRAESAIVQGRVEQALTELDSLPDAARPPLDGWIARAQARVDALAAVQSLAATPENSQ